VAGDLGEASIAIGQETGAAEVRRQTERAVELLGEHALGVGRCLSFYAFDSRATPHFDFDLAHCHMVLLPAAEACVPFGFVLARVRVRSLAAMDLRRRAQGITYFYSQAHQSTLGWHTVPLYPVYLL